MVCYYGLHYVSIFHSIIKKDFKTTSINTNSNTANNEANNNSSNGDGDYLLFDDETISNIGNWDAVKIKCIKSCYQPVLLLYELEK